VFTAAAALSVLVMMLVLDTTLYSLMLVAEQIVHGLHWVECTERNLYEYCIPVAHRTIPETWQLECLQILTILYDIGNDYSVGLTDNFTAEYTSMGGSIVSKESYSTGDKDFNAQLTKIKAANPEVIYLPDYYGTVALIAKQLRAQGINVPIVGADGWDGLTDNAGDEVLNGYYSNHYSENSSSAAVQTFVKSFKAKYNKAPNSFAALGYDCVYMLRDAMKASGSTDDSAKIRDALEATNGDYVTGHIVFDANRNPVKSAVMIKLVKADDGKLATAYEATVDISK